MPKGVDRNEETDVAEHASGNPRMVLAHGLASNRARRAPCGVSVARRLAARKQVAPRKCRACANCRKAVWIMSRRLNQISRRVFPALDAIADKVLAHKPKPKSKPARKRARRAKKIAQAADA